MMIPKSIREEKEKIGKGLSPELKKLSEERKIIEEKYLYKKEVDEYEAYKVIKDFNARWVAAGGQYGSGMIYRKDVPSYMKVGK